MLIKPTAGEILEIPKADVGAQRHQWRLVLHNDGADALCFEYGLKGAGNVVASPLSDLSRCSVISTDPDLDLHKKFLFGAVQMFDDFFILLNALKQGDGDKAISHTDYLTLLDYRSDSLHSLRESVLDPLVAQTEIIGHLQWTHRYLSERNTALAELHLKEARKKLEAEDIADKTRKPNGSSLIFHTSTRRALWDVLHVLQARRFSIGARIDREQPVETQTRQEAEINIFHCLGQVTDTNFQNYQKALAWYRLGRQMETMANQTLGGLSSRAALEVEEHYAEAKNRFERAIEAANTVHGSCPGTATAILLSACHLALGRVRNTVERIKRNLAPEDFRTDQEAEGFLTTALECAEEGKNDGPALAILVDGCAEFELGNWDKARERWRELATLSINATSSQDALDRQTRAAALFNIIVGHIARKDYRDAIEVLRELSEFQPGYKANYFSHLPARLQEPNSLSDDDFQAIFAHVAQSQPPEHISSPLASVLDRKTFVLKGRTALCRFLSYGDFSRYRRHAGADLDLLLVMRSLEAVKHHVCEEADSPVAVASYRGRLPATLWDGLSSKSKWLLYEVVTKNVLEQQNGTSPGVSVPAPYGAEKLWRSVIDEYDRHVITPLRFTHRQEQVRISSGLDWWPYVPSTQSKENDADPRFQTAKAGWESAVRKIQEQHPGAFPTGSLTGLYPALDLYTHSIETVFLKELLDGANRHVRPLIRSLKQLVNINGDYVLLLTGPHRYVYSGSVSKGQLWRGVSEADVDEEAATLKWSVEKMWELRNWAAHEDSGASKPDVEEVKAAWRYLVTNTLLVASHLDAAHLGGSQPSSRGLNDPRTAAYNYRFNP